MTDKNIKPVVTGHCMGCKKKARIRKGKKEMMKNGRPAYRGVCWVCGGGMYKILSKADAERLS